MASSTMIQDAYMYSNEAKYAIFPNAVLDYEQIKRIYNNNGFSVEEIDKLHKTFTFGKFITSENGRQMAYVVSVGKNASNEPMRQIVILLKFNLLQYLINGIDTTLPHARYVLEDGLGNALTEAPTDAGTYRLVASVSDTVFYAGSDYVTVTIASPLREFLKRKSLSAV